LGGSGQRPTTPTYFSQRSMAKVTDSVLPPPDLLKESATARPTPSFRSIPTDPTRKRSTAIYTTWRDTTEIGSERVHGL
jgi:hypothetical protein